MYVIVSVFAYQQDFIFMENTCHSSIIIQLYSHIVQACHTCALLAYNTQEYKCRKMCQNVFYKKKLQSHKAMMQKLIFITFILH